VSAAVKSRSFSSRSWYVSSSRPFKARTPSKRRSASLPSTYAPDLNLIEEAFSKIERILLLGKARKREALMSAIGKALDSVIDRIRKASVPTMATAYWSNNYGKSQ